MAKALPTTGIQKGTPGGRQYTNSIPVTTALPSEMVMGLPLILWQMASLSTAETTPARTNHKARVPKK